MAQNTRDQEQTATQASTLEVSRGEDDVSVSPELAPFAYTNWKAMEGGASSNTAYECGMFTDAHILSTIKEGYGPYQLFNTVSIRDVHKSRPAIILRIAEYRSDEPDLMRQRKTNVERYHGGGLADEVAALISLCLGIRLKCGGVTRLFESSGDTRGWPVSLDNHADPIVPELLRTPVLPRALGQHSLDDATALTQLTRITPRQAVALVRAARMYQEGLWIAESSPETSWLLFVSAIETAALCHFGLIESVADQVTKLEVAKPELVAHIKEHGGSALVSEVAGAFAASFGVTQRFVKFVIAFLPEPPDVRPPDFYQHRWSKTAMRESVNKIYEYRSKALHEGIPFPAPMCHSPWTAGDGVFAEKFHAFAMGTQGGVWQAEDIPMLLHTFEYIVRKVLLRWWQSMAAGNA